MLQTLHDKFSGIIAKIVLGIIVVVFGGFFGIQSYMNPQSETFVAKVDGKEISQDKFRESYNRYRSQMQERYGKQFDATTFDTPERKREVLDEMINEQLLTNANEKLGTMVPPAQIREMILGNPAFQQDGKFDKDRYRMLLQSVNPPMTPAMYEDSIRSDIAIRQLPTQLAQVSVVTDAQVSTYLRLRDQTRDFRYVKID